MKVLTTLLLIGSLFYLSNCSHQKPEMEKNEVITKYSELTNFEQKSVWIKGRYTIHNPYPKGKFRPSNLPVKIVLDDDKGVFLEPFWHPNSIQNPKDIEQFRERLVYVKGTFYSEMPPDSTRLGEIVSTMGGACLFPVDSIVLAE